MKYDVKIYEVHSTIVRNVEATCEIEAKEKAMDILGDDKDPELSYEYTLEPEDWKIWKK